MTSEELARDCARMLVEKHAQDVRILDLRGLTDIADFFVIASANSQPHMKTLAETIEDFLVECKIEKYHIEGIRGMKWVLVDMFDIIIHIFLPDIREFYDIESYWGDAEATLVGNGD